MTDLDYIARLNAPDQDAIEQQQHDAHTLGVDCHVPGCDHCHQPRPVDPTSPWYAPPAQRTPVGPPPF